MTSQIQERQEAEFDFSAYKQLYLREARVCLITLRQNLLQLRDETSASPALFDANRAAHTLKGMSATMRYGSLTALASGMEELLFVANGTGQPLTSGQIKKLLADCDDFETGLDGLAADKKQEGGTK